MARRVQRHPVRERRADVDHAELVDQELGQLEHPIAHRRDPLAHVRDAGRRRRDDRLVAREHAREARHQPARLVLVARVDVHLAAARLLQRELDLAAEPLEQLDHGPARRREQRVVEARDEKRDLIGTFSAH